MIPIVRLAFCAAFCSSLVAQAQAQGNPPSRSPSNVVGSNPFKIPSGTNPCRLGMCGPSTPTGTPVFPVEPRPPAAPTTVLRRLDPLVSTPTVGPITGRRLAVTNECGERIRLAISYLKVSNEWTNAGWWNLPVGQTAVLSSSAHGQVRSLNRVFYLYAESSNHSWIEIGRAHV